MHYLNINFKKLDRDRNAVSGVLESSEYVLYAHVKEIQEHWRVTIWKNKNMNTKHEKKKKN